MIHKQEHRKIDDCKNKSLIFAVMMNTSMTSARMNTPLAIRTICVLLLVFVASGIVSATNTIKYISNVNGLTNNSVNCILEDSENTIWIGTWDGLNAYNGREILTFRYSKSNSNSISNNVIRQIIEHKSSLWIATDNGINRLDKPTRQITRYYLQADNNKIPHQEKSFILGKSKDGQIICLVKGFGLFYYNEQADGFRPVKTDFTELIKDYCIDGADNVAFLFTDGSVRHVKLERLLDGIQQKELNTVRMDVPVSQIFESDGRLILNEKNSILLLNHDFTLLHRISLDIHKPVSQVIMRGGSLFISFIEGGCIDYQLDKDTYAYLNELSGQLSVFTLYFGSQNILWVGTDGQGLIQLYSYESLFQTVHTTHPVRSFCEDKKGNILVGTKGSGIKLLDVETKQLTHFLDESKGLASNSVYALARNREDDIFIGTEGVGIHILNAATQKLERLVIPDKYPVFKAVYNLYFSNNDSLLWVGTSGYGLIKMNLSKEDGQYKVKGFQQYISSNNSNSLNNDVVYAITSVHENVWFGTRGGGLNRICVQNSGMQSLEDIDSRIQLTNNDVLCLLRDGKDLWIGTSYGLNKLQERENDFYMIQYADEKLNNKTIHGVLKDNDGDIWVSTNQGLSHLNVTSNKIDNYTLKDGLQNDEFSDGAFFKDARGFLYFGGVSGMSYFNPQNIHLREFKPSLALSHLKIYNTPQDMNERIEQGALKLSYEERYVSFTFIAKDFINNENCEYAYRLTNHSTDWVETGNNPTIIFAQLPPGNYLLEVKCTNGDKVWGDTVYKLEVKVGYPWWLSIPAWIVYGMLCIVAFYITRSVIKNRIRLSRQILIARIEKQHEQQIFESKLNFFTNVAHEFFTPLTLIYTPAQHLLERTGIDEDMRKYLQIIKNNAERMQQLIHELMEFRKTKSGNMDLHPEQVDIKALVEYASNNYTDILKENKIDFKVEMHGTAELYSDRNALEKIIFNLLSNAFKYTPRNGYIFVDVMQDSEHGNTLYLKIRNSGKGLAEQQMVEVFDKYKIFDTPKFGNSVSNGIGLHLTKTLTEQLGGQINVTSYLGRYVEFSVVIPALLADDVKASADVKELIKEKESVQQKLKPRQDTVVLIVEDEKNIRELLKDVLSDYTVVETCDGLEALNEIERNHPDLIISDIMMPNMDGWQLISKLKSDVKTSHIPIIGISAKASVEDQINAYNQGIDAYIAKPFHPRQVISTIENLLSRQGLLKDYFNSSLSSVKLKDGIILHAEDEELIQNVTEYVKSNIDDESLSPSSIAEFVGVSKATLYRIFKEIMDKTPSEFIRGIRLEYAAKLLRTSKMTVSEIVFKCGFSNKSYFYREFFKQYGVSPKSYREQ